MSALEVKTANARTTGKTEQFGSFLLFIATNSIFMKEKLPKLKHLHAPVDFFGKTFIVQTLCKDDLNRYFSKTRIKKLTDDDMSYLADKLGEALMDCYWNSLAVICDIFKEKK